MVGDIVRSIPFTVMPAPSIIMAEVQDRHRPLSVLEGSGIGQMSKWDMLGKGDAILWAGLHGICHNC